MIIRRKVNRNFTVVPNEPVNDSQLSFEALGLLTYLLSRPDNWQVKLEQLRTRGDLGRDKIQRLVKALIETGYIVRNQNRDMGSKQFGNYEYHVYDEPQNVEIGEPEPENTVAGKIRENEPQPEKPEPVKPEPVKPEPANQAAIIRTESTKSLRGNSASNEAGAGAPEKGIEVKSSHPQEPLSLNKQCWDEAKLILEKKEHGCVPGWIERVASRTDGMIKLLEILKAARQSGTGLPVSYIVGALNKEFPPPPDPKLFDRVTWQHTVNAAIKFRQWDDHKFGPPPGSKGCLVPPELITRDLTHAISNLRSAA